MEVSPELLKLLVCPVTKQKLIYDREEDQLISLEAKLAFPIIDGVPIMLLDKAIKLTDKQIQDLLKKEGKKLATAKSA